MRVPLAGSWCVGELEAQRRRDDSWQGWVRCTTACEGEADEFSGWFDWGDVQVLDVEDVSQHRQGSQP